MKWARRYRARLRAVRRAARGAWKGEPYFAPTKHAPNQEIGCVYISVPKSLLDNATHDPVAKANLINFVASDFEKRGRKLIQDRLVRA